MVNGPYAVGVGTAPCLTWLAAGHRGIAVMASRSHGSPQETDPRSPLVLDVSRLGRRPAPCRKSAGPFPAPRESGWTSSPLSRGRRWTSICGWVGLRRRAGFRHRARAHPRQCSRCLGPVTGDIEIGLTRTVRLSRQPHRDDHWGRRGGPCRRPLRRPRAADRRCGRPGAVRPDVHGGLPGPLPAVASPFHRREPGHHHDNIDPRWAKLARFLPEDGGPEGGTPS